jgi:glycoside hydrolase family 3 protein
MVKMKFNTNEFPEGCAVDMDRRARKHLILVATVALAVLLFCVFIAGCKDKNGGVDDSEGPEYIIPMSVSAEEDAFSLRMIIRDCTASRVVMNVYNGNKTVGSVQQDISVTKQQGTNLTLTLDDFKGKISGNASAEVMIYGKANADDKLNENPLDRAVIQLKDYVVQLGADTVFCVVDAMNNNEKARLVTGYNILTEHESPVPGAVGATAAFEKYGIPSILFADGTAGIAVSDKTTVYPSGSVLASTWNTELAEKVGASLGRDARHFNIDIVLTPELNIQRDILNGQNFAYYSEDPLLTGYMGAAYINGIQSQKVGASVSYFAASNQETARETINVNISERALREIYLTGFEIAVKNSAPYTVTTSYNKINGIYSSVNKNLVTTILRSEWGYKGFVMSEWGASGAITDRVLAQNDLSMPGSDSDVELITKAIDEGKITKEQIDVCCANILRIVTKTNTFNGRNGGDLDTDSGIAISKEAAAEGMVLLKNENDVLPASGKNVAIFGNAQIYTRIGGNGGNATNALYAVSFLEGFENAGYTVDETLKNLYSQCKDDPQGNDVDENPIVDTRELPISSEKAAQAADDNDFAVICISRQTRAGRDHYSGKGDFLLNDRETRLIERVSEAFHEKGKNVVVLINAGNPIEVASWQDQVDAILYTGLAGMETGNVAAEIVSGKINPSGKLTASFPVYYSDTPAYGNFPGTEENVYYSEDLYVGYRFYETFKVKTAYPFGYGLSYTTFEYSDVSVSSNIYTDSLSVTVNVKNTGDMAGKDVVQLYIKKPYSGEEKEQPETILASFAKTELINPGETRKVTLTINNYSMRSYSVNNADWYVDAGMYSAYVAPSVKDTGAEQLRFKFRVENRISLQKVTNCCVTQENLTLYTRFGENAFVPQNQRSSLALGKVFSADCSEFGSGPEYAADGDLSTWWAPDPACDGPYHWISMDLGKVVRISEVVIQWKSITKPYIIEICQDEAEGWTEIGRFTTSFNKQESVLTDTDAQYVQIRVETGGPCAICELEVYE